MSIGLNYNECGGKSEHSIYANVAYKVTYGDIWNPIPNGYEYSWDLGDGSTKMQQNFSHTYTKPGTYTIKLTLKKGSNIWKKDTTVEVLTKAKLYGNENLGIIPLKLLAKDEFIYCLYATQLTTSSNYMLSLLKVNKNLDSLGTIPLSGLFNNVDYIYKIHLTNRNTIAITEYTTYKEFDFDGKLLKEYSLFHSKPSDLIFDDGGTALSLHVNSNSIDIVSSKLDINLMRQVRLNTFFLATDNLGIKSPKFDKNKDVFTVIHENNCCSGKFTCIKIDTLGNKLWDKKFDGTFLDFYIQDDGYVLTYLTTDNATRKQIFNISKLRLNGELLFTTDAKVEDVWLPLISPMVCYKQDDLIWLGLLNLRMVGMNASGRITVNKSYGNLNGKCYPETTNDLFIPDVNKKLVLARHFTYYQLGSFSPSKISLFWSDRNGKILEK